MTHWWSNIIERLVWVVIRVVGRDKREQHENKKSFKLCSHRQAPRTFFHPSISLFHPSYFYCHERLYSKSPALDDESWQIDVPQDVLSYPTRPNQVLGKVISFSIEAIILRMERFSSNRMLNSDHPSKFILMSFNRTFRFPEQPPNVTVEYIIRMMKKGFFLNGIQYRFYHHSNSQSVSYFHYCLTHTNLFFKGDDHAF